jgi:hypothetical protein
MTVTLSGLRGAVLDPRHPAAGGGPLLFNTMTSTFEHHYHYSLTP